MIADTGTTGATEVVPARAIFSPGGGGGTTGCGELAGFAGLLTAYRFSINLRGGG